MPFPFLALAATAVQSDQQARAGGGPGLFELQSLFSGPQAGDQYGAFKPGGMFAPPSLAQFTEAAKGRDVGRTVGSAIAPGIGQAIASLISGPGRGNQRRASARALVQQTPGLASLQRTILSGGTGFNTAERQAISSVIAEARSLGGLGSKYGTRANFLQDVVKYVFTGETAKPKLPVPTLQQLEQLFGSAVPAVTRATRTLPTNYSGSSGRGGGGYWSTIGTVYTGGFRA